MFNLEKIVPSLVTFTRDSQLLIQKRADIAGMIEEMDRAIKAGPKKGAAPAAAPASALPKPEPLPKPAAETPPAAPKAAPPATAPLPQVPQSGGHSKNFGTGKK